MSNSTLIQRVMKYSIILGLTFISFIRSQNIIKVSPSVEKLYDNNSNNFDTINDVNFTNAVKGASKFSLSFWFKTTALSTNDEAIAHLTMLNTKNPWDYANQSQDYKHLSQMIYIEKKSGTLKIYSTDFAQQNLILTTSINANQWYYLYVGIDYTIPLYTAYIYNPISPASSINQDTLFAFGIYNEQLDQRANLYIGGSVDRSDTSSTKRNYNGLIYNAFFIPNFQVNKDNALYMLNDDSNKLYFFNLNSPCKMRIYSDFDQNVYSTFGQNEQPCPDVSDPNQPTFSINSGITFASSQFMTIKLNNEFQNMNFISFWFKLTAFPSAGNKANLFKILSTESKLIISVVILDTQLISIQSENGSKQLLNPLVANTWIKFYCNFAYHNILDSLMATIMIQDEFQATNQKIADFPVIKSTTKSIQVGGEQFQGSIMDILGGQGSFLGIKQLFISQCIASIGISNPVCIYCNSGFFLTNGICSLTCSDGFYRDQEARMCRKCNINCKTCSGPNSNECTSCDNNFPLIFQGNCLNQCPIGSSISTDGSNQCLCHPTCSQCQLDPSNMIQLSCSKCVEVNHYVVDYKCVIAQLCPFNTFANDSTKKCETSCTPLKKDRVNRKCVSICPINTIYSKIKDECLLACPNGQFSSTIAPGSFDETVQQCSDCDTATMHCATCQNSATKCLSCLPNYLIHEYSGVCKLDVNKVCEDGFYNDGNVCRVCQKGCLKCPTDFFWKDNDTCVLQCGIEYIEDKGAVYKCIPRKQPIVKIQNKLQIADPDHEALPVGRQRDLTINAKYYFKGKISQVYWYLSGDSEQYSQTFFSKTFNDDLNLVIPRKNLQPNTLYELNVRVVATTNEYGEDKILIQTSSEIVDGQYTITPSSTGVSGVTKFTVFYKLWSHPTQKISYDLTYYQKTVVTFRGDQITYKDDVHQIFVASSTDGEVSFIFPPFKTDQIFQLELTVYTTDEVKVKQIPILLKKYNGDTISMESEVRRFEPSDSVSIEDYLLITYKMKYLFSQISVDVVKRQFEEEVLRQNQLYQFTSSFCSDDISCRGQGVCQENFYDPSMFGCKCDEDSSGDFCSWDEKILKNNSKNYGRYYTIPMERVIVQIPFETFDYTETVTVQLVEWSLDLIYPRPNSTSNHMELKLYGSQNQQLDIKNLNKQKIIYNFQKKNGFPPLRDDFQSHYFCGHLDTIDFTTTKWIYNNLCTFTFENEFYIRCECNQLDQAIALRGTIEYYQDYLPNSDTLHLYTSKHMNQLMNYYENAAINFDQNIPIAMRPYAAPDYPYSYVPFKWDSPAFILFVIFIVIFLVFSIINYLRIKITPPQSYPTTSKDILLLTYHPFISMVMFGHTAQSHTYQMRLAKFFSLLVGMLAMMAVSFEQIQISIIFISVRQRIIGSAFAAILLNASMNYCVEGLYYIIKRHIYKEKRKEFIYNLLFFLNMIGNAAFGTYCNGYTDKEEYGNFVIGFVIALLVDYFVFDIFVLSYAFYEVDSAYLQFFAFRGFYIIPADKLDKEQYEIINYKKNKFVDLNQLELDRLKQKNQEEQELIKMDPALATDNYDKVSQNQRPMSSHSKKSQASNKIFPLNTNVP